MKLVAAHSPAEVATFSTTRLREEFLATGLFQAGEIRLQWWETDRTVLGAAVPAGSPLTLPDPAELRADYFFERREAGLINLGGAGTITVDGSAYELERCDALYIGRGARKVTFASRDARQPARFWLMSYPAHRNYPTRHVPFQEKAGVRLGTRESANERTLFKMIHTEAFPTCQVVMGFTRMEPGSVWNSMPPHTHLRRSEVYLYFDLPADAAVFHFMGEPRSTRHLVIRDCEAVLSPPWSIHCGAGTSAYSFVWAMGGENQEFADMDGAPVTELF